MCIRSAFREFVRLADESEGPFSARILSLDQRPGYGPIRAAGAGKLQNTACREW